MFSGQYTTGAKCTRLVTTPPQIRNNFIASFHASAMVEFRPLLFWNIMQRRLVVGYQHFRTAYSSQNVGNQLPPYTV